MLDHKKQIKPGSIMKKLLKFLVAGIAVCYPLVIYFGLETLPLKLLTGIILVVFVLRLIVSGNSSLYFLKRLSFSVAAIGILLAATSLLFDSEKVLLFYPVLVSFSSLIVFAWSLIKPPSMIECFARIMDDQLPDEAIAYTRKVTMIWCLFFILNGSFALFTVIHGDYKLWALYNGLLSYIIMGGLLGVEWLYRKWILKV